MDEETRVLLALSGDIEYLLEYWGMENHPIIDTMVNGTGAIHIPYNLREYVEAYAIWCICHCEDQRVLWQRQYPQTLVRDLWEKVSTLGQTSTHLKMAVSMIHRGSSELRTLSTHSSSFVGHRCTVAVLEHPSDESLRFAYRYIQPIAKKVIIIEKTY